MATATRTLKSLQVICPECQSAGTITLDLNSLADCQCNDCGETFSPREAAEKLVAEAQKWAAIATWIETAGDFLAE